MIQESEDSIEEKWIKLGAFKKAYGHNEKKGMFMVITKPAEIWSRIMTNGDMNSVSLRVE